MQRHALDVDELVALARAPVVGTAAERDGHERIDVGEAAGVVVLDRVQARAAVDVVGVRLLVAVGVQEVVAGAAVEAVATVLALEVVAAVAAEQDVVALAAVELVVARAAVERVRARPVLEQVAARPAGDRDRHADGVGDDAAVVAVAELDANRRRRRTRHDLAGPDLALRAPVRDRRHRIPAAGVERERAGLVLLHVDVVRRAGGGAVDERAGAVAGDGGREAAAGSSAVAATASTSFGMKLRTRVESIIRSSKRVGVAPIVPVPLRVYIRETPNSIEVRRQPQCAQR